MARRRKRKSHVYGILLTLYIILLAAAAGYGLTMVWAYAEEYESARPSYAIESYMNSLGDNFWGESMQATIASMPHEVQTDDECAAVVKEMLKDGVTYSRASGSEAEGKIIYNLYCATGRIGTVTIEQDKSRPTQFGMYPWKVSGDSFEFSGLYSPVKATVPQNYSVQVNGVTLGPEYIIESGIHYDVLEEYYANYPNLPTKCTYKIDHVIGILEPVILDENGNVTVIDKNRDDSQFIKSCTPDEMAGLEAFTRDFCTEYFMYISGVSEIYSGYNALQRYIIPGSDLDNRLLAAQDGLSWAHTNYLTIDSFTLNDAIKLDTNTYLCYISSDVTSMGTTTQSLTNNLKLIVTGEIWSDNMKVVGLELY